MPKKKNHRKSHKRVAAGKKAHKSYKGSALEKFNKSRAKKAKHKKGKKKSKHKKKLTAAQRARREQRREEYWAATFVHPNWGYID